MKKLVLLFTLLPFTSFAQVNTVDHWENLVKADDTWDYFEGTQNPDSTWRELSFNGGSWSSGSGGFGFGDNDDNTTINNTSGSIFIRKKFNITDTNLIANLMLVMDYDDGFVAWINGKEICRKNIGTYGDTPSYNTQPLSSHEAQLYQGKQPEYLFVNVAALKGLLNNGSNVLCIQVNNLSGSDDMTCLPWLYAGIKTSTNANITYPSWFSPPLTTHLPIVYINTNGQYIPDNPRITAEMGIVLNEGELNHLGDPFLNYKGHITIETRGSSSQSFPQKPYGFSTVDVNNQDSDVSLCGLPKQHDWIFYAAYTDKSLMRNNLIYDFGRKMGNYAVRNIYVEVIINNSYEGVYVLQEQIKRDKNRVNISKMTSTSNSGDSLTGGYVFKVDKTTGAGGGQGWAASTTTYKNHANNVFYQYDYPNYLNITSQQKAYIKTWMSDFEKALLSNNYRNPSTGYRKYMDVPSFIDFFILNEMSKNVDGYRLSTFMFKTRNSQGGKLVAGPLWDFNITLGNANYCDGGDSTGWAYIFNCDITVIPFWWDRLLTDPTYKNQLQCRWQQLRSNILSDSSLKAYIDSSAEYLRVPAKRNFNRWQILGSYVWPNNYIGQTYQDEVDYLNLWLKKRNNWLDKNMPGTAGTCQSAYADSIYLSEVNYNSPSFPNAGNWIEIYNNSNTAINLTGYTLTDGTNFHSFTLPNKTIQPGAYYVIAEVPTKMKYFYPNLQNITGGFGWSFPNKNGHLILYDAYYNKVFDFRYEDHAPWPDEADGKGKTMEMPILGLDVNEPSNWVNGCIGGSPGEPYGKCAQNIIFSEINFNSSSSLDGGDWVEIFNRSNSDTMDISGWIFRDGDPKHGYSMPSNTFLFPHSYLVLCEDSLKFTTAYPQVSNFLGGFSFGLSSKGDDLLLLYPDSSKYQEMHFENGKTFPTGADGTGYTLELSSDTLDIRNGASWQLSCKSGSPGRDRQNPCYPALFAKLGVTEINYNPHSALDDGGFIEIINKDTVAIDLSYWKLQDGNQSFEFPANTIVKAGSLMVIAIDSAKYVSQHSIYGKVIFAKGISLSKNGGIFFIDDQTGTNALNFQFQSALPWIQDPNGWGYSLELISTDSSGWSYDHWTNGILGGSPGMHPGNFVDSVTFDEINYQSIYSKNTGDWLELVNYGKAPLQLQQAQIGDENGNWFILPDTTIQPNELILVASSLSKLDQAFPTHAPGIELTGWDLNDWNGRILLKNGNGKLLVSAAYNSTTPFPDSTAGLGYTLNRVDLTKSTTLGSNYTKGCLNGSPGWDDQGICNYASNFTIAISELNPFPDASQGAGWFELMNTGNSTLDLSNCFINQKGSNLWNQWTGPKSMKLNTYYVFANDTADFNSRHPGVQSYFWPWPITANNQWQILERFGNILNTINTDASLSWPKGSVYLGRSMERNNWQIAETDASAYGEGCIGGSPGLSPSNCVETYAFSEINHHPGFGNSPKFLEILNTSSQTMSLNPCIIINEKGDTIANSPNGLPTTIQSNERFVLTSDTSQLVLVQPFAVKMILAPNMNLTPSNGSLRFYVGNSLVQSMWYSNAFPWPAAGDGDGYSLEWNNSYPQSLGSNWFTGCENGSPGFVFTNPCPQVVVITGTQNHNKFGIQVYPNPANEYLIVSGIPSKGFIGEWITNDGKRLGKMNLTNNQTLTRPGVSGLYLLEMTDSQTGLVSRFRVIWYQ